MTVPHVSFVTHNASLRHAKLARVFMPLQHQLRMSRLRIPELHTPILAATHDPLSVWCQSHAEHEVFVALEHPNTLAALRRNVPTVLHPVVTWRKLPHPDSLIKTATDQMLPTRRKSHGVNTILVALLTLGDTDRIAGLDVPDADALVERAGGDVAAVGRHGDGGHAVFDGECEDAGVGLDVPEADRAVAGAGGDVAAIAAEVERVDVLVVAGEGVADLLGGDVPNLHESALGVRRQR